MADASVPQPAPRKRRGWLRAIIWVLSILVVLVVVAYFVLTSAAFLKGVILPKAGAALNAKITVSDATIHPFHEVILNNLQVQTTGSEPLVSAPEVHLTYSLGQIIRGNIDVEDITLTSPKIVLVQNPDGTSNLDPIMKALQAQPQKPSAPSKPSKPMQIDIKKVTLDNGTVREVKLYGGNHQDLIEVSNINLSVTGLKNGQTGKLTLAAGIRMDNNPPAPAASGSLGAKLDANYSIGLSADLKPGVIQGATHLNVLEAQGSLAQAANFGAGLDCNVTPTEVKQIALTFQRGGTPLGAVQVAGPLDMEKLEGRLTIQVVNIDKNLLNIAGAGSGVDFGPTTISSSNLLELAKGGSAISAAGQFNINQFQLTRTNQTTPPLDLSASYDVNVDRSASVAVIRALTLKGVQNGAAILNGELTSPMTVSWGKTSNEVGNSALTVAVTHLDLANWKAFLGDVAPAGDVNVKLQLTSKQGGKNLAFDLNSQIANLTAGAGSNRITQATVTMNASGEAVDFKQFNLPEYKFQVAQASQVLASANGSGAYDQGAGTADFQLNAQLMLARLLQALPQPNLNLSSGTTELKVRIVQKPLDAAASKTPAVGQTVTGSFALADLSGKMGSTTLQSFGTTADVDIGATPDQVEIRKLAGQITQGQATGGRFECTGTYGLSNKTARLTAKLINFNQDGLKPFLEPALGGKTLVSVSLNGNSSVQYDPLAASVITGDLQVTNLVVKDPKGQFPATPLSIGAKADLSLNKQVADIKLLELDLTPTARGSNVVQLAGHVDMSQTNAIQGNLKLSADSLDLTSYYDLFSGQSKPTEKPSAPGSVVKPTPTAPAATADKEPEPQQFPLKNFVADANIRHVYLHEVEVADIQTSTKVDGGHIVLNPFKLVLNGAPVSSTIDADLGVPGYKYALSFNAQAIPLAPLVNTFQPDRKGQVAGTLTAQAQIKGQGITGANLQKNLSGQFDIGSTNLNLAVVNIRSPLLRVLINVVALVPDLIKNPASGLGSLLQEVTGKSTGGLSEDLSKSPVDTISAKGGAGDGKVTLQQALVQSAAFRAEAMGTVTLAPILTNSALDIPVSVYLSQPIAQRLNLVAANTPTNSAYFKLPDFLTIKGTEGNPDPVINKLALAGVALQGIGKAIPGGSKAGNIVQGLQGLLGGGNAQAPATNAAPSQPATNQSPVGNLLNRFLKPKK